MERLLRLCICVVCIVACEMAFCLSSLIAELCFVVLQATRASTFVGGGLKVHDAWSMRLAQPHTPLHGQWPMPRHFPMDFIHETLQNINGYTMCCW